MFTNFLFSFLIVFSMGTVVFAQQAIIELENDDTLPIAPTRYDDAVEPPKDNFSSVRKNDNWEKFERGELNEKAFVRLQEEYQMAANASKDPYVKRKIASDLKEKKREALIKKKEEKAAKLAEEKQKKKREEATKFDREIDLMAKEKETAKSKAEAEAKAAAQKQAKEEAKAKAKLAAKKTAKLKATKAAMKNKRMPASKRSKRKK